MPRARRSNRSEGIKKMIRNLKALGLALVAVFAMSAVASSMASAEVTKPGLFTFGVAATELSELHAEQVGATPDTFTLNGLALTCGTVTLTGNPVKTKASPNEDIVEANTKGSSSTDITLTPTYDKCHVVIAGLTKTITVTTNDCSFVFDAKTTETKGVVSNTALTTIECPAGKKIEIHIYSTAGTEVGTTCTYDVEATAANTTLPGIKLDNKVNTPASADDILATIKVEGIEVNNTIKSAVCGQNAIEKATYDGEDTIRATNEAHAFVDMSASS